MRSLIARVTYGWIPRVVMGFDRRRLLPIMGALLLLIALAGIALGSAALGEPGCVNFLVQSLCVADAGRLLITKSACLLIISALEIRGARRTRRETSA